jgi:hypothetical protein
LSFYAAMAKSGIFTRSSLAVASCPRYRNLNGQMGTMADQYARIPARAISYRELSAHDWRVLVCIASHADGAGRAYPSMARISAMTGIGRGNVPRAIARLERLGLLRRQSRAGDSAVNLYKVIFDLDEPEASAAVGVITRDDRGVISREDGVSSLEMQSVISVDALNRPEQTNEQYTVDIHRQAARSARARAREARVRDKDAATSEFDAFWRMYPHRGSFSDPKKPARLKFEAAVKRGVDPAAIIAGAERYRAHIEQHGTEARFVAQAKTWLNEERWAQLDEFEAPPRLRVGMN